MKILILLLVSFSVYGSYALKTDLRNCETQPVTSHTRMSDCGQGCVEITNKFKCETYLEQDTQVDDLTKPKYTKSNETVCSGEEDCRTVADSLPCPQGESGLTSDPYIEAYCSSYPKPSGYLQKTVQKFREDATKKAAYDAGELAKKNRSDARKTKIAEMKTLKTKLEDGGNLTVDERRDLDLLLIYKLRE